MSTQFNVAPELPSDLWGYYEQVTSLEPDGPGSNGDASPNETTGFAVGEVKSAREASTASPDDKSNQAATDVEEQVAVPIEETANPSVVEESASENLKAPGALPWDDAAQREFTERDQHIRGHWTAYKKNRRALGEHLSGQKALLVGRGRGGQWEPYLREVGIPTSSAERFIRGFERYQRLTPELRTHLEEGRVNLDKLSEAQLKRLNTIQEEFFERTADPTASEMAEFVAEVRLAMKPLSHRSKATPAITTQPATTKREGSSRPNSAAAPTTPERQVVPSGGTASVPEAPSAKSEVSTLPTIDAATVNPQRVEMASRFREILASQQRASGESDTPLATTTTTTEPNTPAPSTVAALPETTTAEPEIPTPPNAAVATVVTHVGAASLAEFMTPEPARLEQEALKDQQLGSANPAGGTMTTTSHAVHKAPLFVDDIEPEAQVGTPALADTTQPSAQADHGKETAEPAADQPAGDTETGSHPSEEEKQAEQTRREEEAATLLKRALHLLKSDAQLVEVEIALDRLGIVAAIDFICNLVVNVDDWLNEPWESLDAKAQTSAT